MIGCKQLAFSLMYTVRVLSVLVCFMHQIVAYSLCVLPVRCYGQLRSEYLLDHLDVAFIHLIANTLRLIVCTCYVYTVCPIKWSVVCTKVVRCLNTYRSDRFVQSGGYDSPMYIICGTLYATAKSPHHASTK